MPRTSDLSIGKLSRQTGCNIETIRYYERIGLLPEPRRTSSRYRLYDDADVRRLSFIRRARELGFVLAEVRALLGLVRSDERSCARARALAVGHLADVRDKIADLQAMERVLASVIRQCARGRRPNCPLIETLSAGARPSSRGARPGPDQPPNPRPSIAVMRRANAGTSGSGSPSSRRA